MKVNTISRYGIVPILQHGQQSPYLKDLCIRLIQSSVSFSLQDKHNESRQDFQLLDSRKIATWPAKPQVLGDHVRKYTTELSVSGMDNRKHIKVDQFPIWIIATAREEGTLTTLNYEVEVHLNQIF